jgi:hypothetical protein
MADRANPDVLRPRLLTPLQQILRDRACNLYWLGKPKQAHNLARYKEVQKTANNKIRSTLE